VSAYRVAIDQTTRAIDRRAKYYRNLIVTVVSICVGSLGWSIATRSLSPLSGFLLLFPVCGLYFFIDAKLLHDWRSKLLEGWIRGELDFRAFRQAVGANPSLPKDTLQGMLATLPESGDLITEQGVSPGTRSAVSAVATTMHACQSDATAIRVAGIAIAVFSSVLALLLWTWHPLLGMLAFLSLPLLRRWLKLCRLRGLGERILAARHKSDFNQNQYMVLLNNLNWDPISSSERGHLLLVLNSVK
jgi:hypothetical protein